MSLLVLVSPFPFVLCYQSRLGVQSMHCLLVLHLFLLVSTGSMGVLLACSPSVSVASKGSMHALLVRFPSVFVGSISSLFSALFPVSSTLSDSVFPLWLLFVLL